jgi:hypothetical protein
MVARLSNRDAAENNQRYGQDQLGEYVLSKHWPLQAARKDVAELALLHRRSVEFFRREYRPWTGSHQR